MTISLRKIARLAGCAPSTVSRVLSGNFGTVHVAQKTQEKIRAICEEFNYVPDVNASRLYSKQTKVIGLICQATPQDLNDPNFSRFMAALYGALTDRGYRLQFFLLDEAFLSPDDVIALYKCREVDGLVLWGLYGPTDWLVELKLTGCPFVLAGNRCGDFPSVTCDDAAGMEALVRRCRERGARSFIYLDGPNIDVAIRRRKAFETAAEGFSCQILSCQSFCAEPGREIAGRVCEQKPDAVLCVSDMLAIGLLCGIYEAGLCVPDDVLVTGADNIPVSATSVPPLSTYDNMMSHCGTVCAEKLIACLGAGEPIVSETVLPELHLRATI